MTRVINEKVVESQVVTISICVLGLLMTWNFPL